MTMLRYMETDWDEVRDQLTAWWRRDMPDRPILAVTAPRDTPLAFPEPPPKTGDDRANWLDVEAVIKRFEHGCSRRFYGGVAFPYLTPDLGPGCLNIYLGAEPVFSPTTVWYQPVFDDPRTASLRLDPGNPYWTWTLAALDRIRTAGAGRFLAGIPDLIEGLDVLSELLGTETLLTALVDCPEEIHRLLGELDRLYWEAFNPLYERVRDDRDGNAFIAFQIWGPGRTLKSQCDFSAMISPDMFAEFVCPSLERQCAQADFSVYHLDGVKALPHLEHLLRVKSLTAIQWTPGYPNPSSADPMWWKPVWEKVLGAGKAALALGNRPHQVEPFLKEFGWTGTFLGVHPKTEADARRLLREAPHWR